MKKWILYLTVILAMSSGLALAHLDEGTAEGKYAQVEALHLAAEQGDANAQNKLGEMFLHGVGVTPDTQEAVKWFRLAAKQGHAIAQFNLGVSYGNGQGVAQDYQEAAKWFRSAAEQGGCKCTIFPWFKLYQQAGR